MTAFLTAVLPGGEEVEKREPKKTVFTHWTSSKGKYQNDVEHPENCVKVVFLFTDANGIDHFAATTPSGDVYHHIGTAGDEFKNPNQ